MQKLDIKMRNWRLKFRDFPNIKNFVFNDKKEITKINSQIYSQRKGSYSPRSFRFKKTGRID